MSAVPFGGLGILVIAIVTMVAFTLGQFTFLGPHFLAYWPLVLGGWMAGLIVLSAVWGIGIECFIWSALSSQSARSLAALRWLAAALIIFLGTCALAHRQYQCLLVAMPALSLLVFAITAGGQVPIIQALREKGRDGAAFAALLVLAAVMMFLDGELMAVDH